MSEITLSLGREVGKAGLLLKIIAMFVSYKYKYVRLVHIHINSCLGLYCCKYLVQS